MTQKFEDNYSKLTSFGLTPNQAKTYLALIRLGESTAKKVWTQTEIPREEVYRKLNELEDLGFVEKTLSVPRIFKASPLEVVLQSLLHKKAEDLSQMQQIAEDLLL
jgi:sugar-specific transcriptional regulator TrmB